MTALFSGWRHHTISNKSIIYIDGLNLYYGAIHGTRNKWLNIQRMFELLRPHDDIQVIRYFTALVEGPAQIDQLKYLRALGTCLKVEIIPGKFKTKRVNCGVRDCTYSGPRFFTTPEEKRTDVNIALHLLNDAYQDRTDRFVIVSGDSDLVPALHMIKCLFPKKQLIVYIPARNEIRGAAVEMRSAADKSKTLPLALLKVSQFPVSFPDGMGGTITKPAGW